MGKNSENLSIEEGQSRENGQVMGKNSNACISNTQERLGEVIEEKIYKKHSIDFWLNDVFWLPEGEKRLLKTKVDFNKIASIRDLLEETEIKDEERNLSSELVINLADACFVSKYRDKFFDYLESSHLDGVNHIYERVSVYDFLKLLCSFEKFMVKEE